MSKSTLPLDDTPDDDIIPIDRPSSKPPSFTPASLLPAQLHGAISTILPKHHRLVDTSRGTKREVIEVENDDWTGDGRVKLLKRKQGDDEDEKEVEWISVRANGVEYSVDDSVEIRTGPGRSSVGLIRKVTSIQPGNRKRAVMAHVQWMTPYEPDLDWRDPRVQELFLTDAHCDSVSISKVVRKVDIHYMQPDTRVQTDVWRRYCRFVFTADHRVRDPLRGIACDSCHRKTSLLSSPAITALSLQAGPTASPLLHLHHFVLIDPRITGRPFLIGQLHAFLPEKQLIKVRIFRRRAELVKEEYKDERQVCMTDEYSTFPAELVRGRCYVLSSKEQLSKWDDDPTFLCDSRWSQTQNKVVALQRGLSDCQPCKEQRLSCLYRNRQFSELATQLRVADYYSGGGGGILSARKYFSVVSAVEMNPTACSTIARNCASVTISCATVADLVRREKQYEAGGNVDELYDERDLDRPQSRRRTVPRLPPRGSILLMMGGVPCQGHSRANQHQQADDERNEELFVFLSEVERVQPSYVIIENVPGFKDDRMDGSFNDEGEVKSYAAAAQTLLIKLDYQCQMAILDARSFGSAQNRARLWIVAAKRGLPFPDIPLPTHANPKVRATVISRSGIKTSSYAEIGTPGCGAYPAVTVEEAISDLPRFDFQLPGIPARSDIPSFPAGSAGKGTDTRVGFDRSTPYCSQPTTLFQKRMRGDRTEVEDHFTPSRSLAEVEKCHNAFDARLEADLMGREKRLEPDGGFKALLTTNAPGQRASRPIHYDQRRTKTIAEDKRAMGFPDAYLLSGSAKKQIAQLGNAWCVHMGRAVVRSVHDAIKHEWLRDGQPKDLQAWWELKSEQMKDEKNA